MATLGPLFFYLTILNQDLVSKLTVSRVVELPTPPSLKVIARPGAEGEEGLVVVRIPYPSTIFSWLVLVDSLVGRTFPCPAGRVLVGVRGSEPRWWVGGGLFDERIPIQSLRWFSNFFFLWYSGVFNRKLVVSESEEGGLVEIEYVKYFPTKTTKGGGRGWSFTWGEFEGCEVLPEKVTREPTCLQTTFSFLKQEEARGVYNGAVLSCLRYTQRAVPKSKRTTL